MLSRREFLQRSAGFVISGAGAGALVGCAGQPASHNAKPGWFLTRGAVLVVKDMQTLDWPALAKEAGRTTLATHIRPSEIVEFVQTEAGERFLDGCHRHELQVEHELHALGDLLPRNLFEQDKTMFRMNEQGERVRDHNLCIHSTAALEVVAENAVRYARLMEQGKAQALENVRAQARRGVPLNMEVAVGANGLGVLKGYRWESLGIVVSFDTVRTTNSSAGFTRFQDVMVGAAVELENHGPEPVAIVELPGGRSYGLVCDARWRAPAYRWVGETNTLPTPEPRDVVVLQPGQRHTSRLDLTQPEWYVVDIRTNSVDRLPQPLQQLAPDWSSGFRIEYRPPPPEACATLPNADLIWHRRLRSRWFNPMGNLD